MNKNERIKAALEKAYLDEVNELCSSNLGKWEFTEEFRFEKKMEKLIRQEKSGYWKYINTLGKKVAVFIITFLLVFNSTIMLVPAFREPVIEFVVKVYEEFSTYFLNKNSMNLNLDSNPYTIETVFCPATIPENFVLVDYAIDQGSVFFTWSDLENDDILFVQDVITDGGNIDTEDSQLVEFNIAGVTGYKYVNGEITAYLWVNYGYSFKLYVPSAFSENSVFEIILSVSEKK